MGAKEWIAGGVTTSVLAGGAYLAVGRLYDHYHDQGERLCAPLTVEGLSESEDPAAELRQAIAALTLEGADVRVRLVDDGRAEDGINNQEDVDEVAKTMMGQDTWGGCELDDDYVVVYSSNKPQAARFLFGGDAFDDVTEGEKKGINDQLKRELADQSQPVQTDVAVALQELRSSALSRAPRELPGTGIDWPDVKMPNIDLPDLSAEKVGIGAAAVTAIGGLLLVRRRRRLYAQEYAELTSEVVPKVEQLTAEVGLLKDRVSFFILDLPQPEQITVGRSAETRSISHLANAADALWQELLKQVHEELPPGVRPGWWHSVVSVIDIASLDRAVRTARKKYNKLSKEIEEAETDLQELPLRRQVVEELLGAEIVAQGVLLTQTEVLQLRAAYDNAKKADRDEMPLTASRRYKAAVELYDRLVTSRLE